MRKARIFVSYAHDDPSVRDIVERLRETLSRAGYDVLFDDDIRAGEQWSSEIYQWLFECAGAVVVASPKAKNSDWCQREWHVLAARASAKRTTTEASVRVIPVLSGLPSAELGPLANLNALDGTRSDLLERITEAFRGAHEPWVVDADDVVALHSAWIRYQFEQAPVLGRERFALSEVYIDTEGGSILWKDMAKEDGKVRDPFDERNEQRKPLLQQVLQYMADPAFKEVVVVQGAPGSGKSAFTLRLANELMSMGLEPLLIRFRDMRLAIQGTVPELLGDALQIGPELEQPVLPEAPIFSEARLRRTTTFKYGKTEATICRNVVILDGWDEVSLASSTGYQAQLGTWLPRFRQFFVDRRGPPVRLIVTGRPTLEVSDSGFLSERTRLLTMWPIRPDQLEMFARTCTRLGGISPPDTAFLERYREWYQSRSGGVEILGQPLLALLVLKTLSVGGVDLSALLSAPSALYKALIDQTVPYAGKADISYTVPNSVHRGGGSLRRLLQRTASAISIFHSERIAFDELDKRLHQDSALRDWKQQFEKSVEVHPLHALIVNFWFKGGHHGLGCEFLHKSFREYLFAEGIVQTLIELSDGHAKTLPPPALPFWHDFPSLGVHHRASRALAKVLAPQWLTPDVRKHLFWLVDVHVGADRARWTWVRDLLVDVYAWWAEGVHLRPQGDSNESYIGELASWCRPLAEGTSVEPMRFATLDSHLGDALMQLTACVHASLNAQEPESADIRDLKPVDRRPYQVAFGQTVTFRPGGGYWRHLVARMTTGALRPFGEDAAGSFLEGVSFIGETSGFMSMQGAQLNRSLMSDANFAGVNLRAAQLAGASLQGSNFDGANLEDADLTNCNLERTNLQRANLRRANLSGARLIEGKLDGANLEGAQMKGAQLQKASFRHARMSGANLREANLDGAILESAVLATANLQKASLRRANLAECRLRGADLSEADLTEATLFGANLYSADLTSANLSRASLREAKLEEAHLHQANLENAVLQGANLRGAHLSKANLEGTDLTDTDRRERRWVRDG